MTASGRRPPTYTRQGCGVSGEHRMGQPPDHHPDEDGRQRSKDQAPALRPAPWPYRRTRPLRSCRFIPLAFPHAASRPGAVGPLSAHRDPTSEPCLEALYAGSIWRRGLARQRPEGPPLLDPTPGRRRRRRATVRTEAPAGAGEVSETQLALLTRGPFAVREAAPSGSPSLSS